MVQESTGRTGGGQPRIDVWRVGKRMLFALVLPCLIAIAIDIVANTWPIVTLLVAGFAFPIAGFLVMRASLQEMQRVIQEVAPEDPPDGQGGDSDSAINTE